MRTALERARAAASAYLADRGYAHEAQLAADGQGDDFAEVRLALTLLTAIEARDLHYARALDFYADGRADDGLRARLALSGAAMPVDTID